ncbi:MAG: HTH domain-containing protein, partial [Thermovirgaceae bacterium]|nr:HTH domain-containing protein [Thermovirgaceae bacterium]
CCRFNELAELSGLSERTAYRALKEIKQSGLFVIVATPGVGVQISAGWLWSDLSEGARKILEDEKIGFK